MVKKSIYPSPVSGYELSPVVGFFGVIEPKETTNECLNPSFELDTSLWGAVSLGGFNPPTLARDATEQRRGAWSLKVTTDGDPTHDYEGAEYDFTFSASTKYGISVDLKGHPGEKFRMFVGSGTGQPSTAISPIVYAVGNGEWTRLELPFAYDPGGLWAIFIEKYRDHASPLSANPFWIDGLQIEEGEISTYFDGDTKGLVRGVDHYYWVGTPHASASYRSGDARNGGVVHDFNKLGMDVLGFVGLGMDPENHILIPRGLVGGSEYQRSVPAVREWTLLGAFSGEDYQQLKRQKENVQNLLSRKITVGSQPAVLVYQAVKECGDPIGDPFHLPSIYTGGLEDSIDNLHQERVAISFQMPDPALLVDGDGGANDNLWYQETFYYIGQRPSDTGDWTYLGPGNGTQGPIYSLVEGIDGRIYIGGEFTQIRPGTNAYRVCYYTPSTDAFGQMDASLGLNNIVRCMVSGPDGDIYIGGDFDTEQGGVANLYDGITRYDVSANTFNALAGGLIGTNVGNAVYDLAWHPKTGDLYAAHTVDNGPFVQGRVSYWDGSAWNTAFTAGIGELIYALEFAPDGTLFFGGTGCTFAGPVTDVVFSWDGTTISVLGPGLNGIVYDLVMGDDNILYVGGRFTADNDGNTLQGVCGWDGNQFFALGDGVTQTVTGVANVGVTNLSYHDGTLYVTGNELRQTGFRTTAGIDHYDSFAIWNGSSFVRPDFSLNSTLPPVITAMPSCAPLFGRDGTMYLCMELDGAGFGSSVSPRVSETLTVENEGTENAYPLIEFVSTGVNVRLLWLRNETTNETIFFDQLFQANERLYLDLERKTFYSNINGNIRDSILPGSDLAKFHLKPETNYLTVYGSQQGGAASTTDIRLWFRIRHRYSSGALY